MPSAETNGADITEARETVAFPPGDNAMRAGAPDLKAAAKAHESGWMEIREKLEAEKKRLNARKAEEDRRANGELLYMLLYGSAVEMDDETRVRFERASVAFLTNARRGRG